MVLDLTHIIAAVVLLQQATVFVYVAHSFLDCEKKKVVSPKDYPRWLIVSNIVRVYLITALAILVLIG